MNAEDARRIVNVVMAAWGEDFTKDRSTVWISAILDLPFDPSMQAVQRLTKTRSTCPAPATIRREVMGDAGVLPPNPQEAIAQADRWLVYQDQLSYANGSGWTPPIPDIHPAVVRACALVNGDFAGWRRDFLAAYSQSAGEAEGAILSSDYGHVVAALGSGS